MQKIEIGEYLRTKAGNIDRLKEITEENRYLFEKSRIIHTEENIKNMIVKHSKNIIDLIEDGDYLNGYLVRKINGELCNFDLNTMKWTPLKNIDIFESLVTKQKFESIEYKI